MSLRQRKPGDSTASSAEEYNQPGEEKTAQSDQHYPEDHKSSVRQDNAGADGAPAVSKGKTPSGQIFDLPQTHDVLSGLFDPRITKSSFDKLILLSFTLQLGLWATLPLSVSRWLFLAYFAFWRLSYDVGLGCILTKQSETRWIVRWVEKHGWMDKSRHPKLQAWIQSQLECRMGKDYKYEALPLEYNVWLAFRHLVDLILMNDFLAYCCFAWSWYTLPPQNSVPFHVLRWVVGWSLIYFNVVVKTDAHRVIKDYAWYWGDAFFLSLQNLVFDGVFELAPHPMYSAGYAGYYGLSLVVGSYTVFFASLAAHLFQFGFLVFFENPHIERTYGERVPLAQRVPLKSDLQEPSSQSEGVPKGAAPLQDSTPSQTDASTDTETDEPAELPQAPPRRRPRRSTTSTFGADRAFTQKETSLITQLTQHDLNSRYFQHEAVVFTNWDPLRSRDVGFGLAVFYVVVASIMPYFSQQNRLALLLAHAAAWRLFHSFCLGLMLKKQSESKWMVRHFIKHYYYTQGATDEPVKDAFKNWIGIYNLSLIMTYLSFGLLALQSYQWPGADSDYQVLAFRHVAGCLLIALHGWTARETFCVLGDFGWFYGDFFIEEYPKALYYTGIYRFLNNPERIMGGASFLGMSLFCGSKLVASLAICSIFGHLWFLQYVERPHMEKLYGQAIRKTSGVRKSLSALVDQNVTKGHPELGKWMKGLAGLSEKVYDETTGSFDSFVKSSEIKLLNLVTKSSQLAQARQNMTLTRLGKVDGIDVASYSLKALRALDRSSTPSHRFHLGERIILQWAAPADHARSDWIGIYPLGVNKASHITQVSSRGHWIGLYPDEWSGNEYVPGEGATTSDASKESSPRETGIVAIDQIKQLPPKPGMYELRYHHAGKHNVLARCGPIEIYVEKPEDPNDIDDIYDTLLSLVRHSLGNDPTLLPPACMPHKEDHPVPENNSVDNFMFDSKGQAQMLSAAIAASCGVELADEVVIASANVTDLAQRVAEARHVLGLNQQSSA